MLFFSHGPDIYRLRTALEALVSQLSAGRSVIRVTTDANDDQGLVECRQALTSSSLLNDATIVIIRNALANADTAGTVQKLLVQHPVADTPDVFVIVCHEGPAGRESSATKSLTAFLTKHATEVSRFESLAGAELLQWIASFCAARNASIQAPAASLLAGRTGNDSWRLAMELEKLCAYAGSEAITPAMVQMFIADEPERNEFALSNALAIRDKRGAIAELYQRLAEGDAEYLLLGAIAYSIRTLHGVADLAARHTPPGSIAKMMGLAPFVVSKTLQGASAYPPESLARAHEAVAHLDRAVKDGQADIRDGLYAILFDL